MELDEILREKIHSGCNTIWKLKIVQVIVRDLLDWLNLIDFCFSFLFLFENWKVIDLIDCE